ncbi:MAG: helix-turn-helix transcriptional regulator [Methanothrix sp.]|nr:helix-turn-helix transcriptional regulator [Methanothrix sp.]OPX82709.1 MAG: anaerobic benzoate catabolism transcriptional regulator [Methanosaeta sp. PtaB.Bin087]OPY52524.1 MAG: anaerobic benzoate catabolism transcriptional regulator [Methanosaeta sp. PtaU1.Bin055]NLX38396.1 helix-turn-helix transcriptional regulator [Methanothrix sp.]HNR57427.1 helix-turn-helix transcriptional regulator [Methanothrix sp.]
MKTRIKELRARENLTQADLASMVKVRRETILFLEKGKYNPSLKLAHKVAVALRSTIDEVFIFGDEDLL